MSVFQSIGRVFVLLLSIAFAGGVQAQVELITADEARLPEAKHAATRAITRGPQIRLTSSSDVQARSFGLKLSLEARGGSRIDPASLRVEYLKEPPVDISARLAPAFKGDVIDIAQATVPAGVHHLRVSVKDSEGRSGSTVISLHAR